MQTSSSLRSILTMPQLNVTQSLKAAIDVLQGALTFDPVSGHTFDTTAAIPESGGSASDLAKDAESVSLTQAEIQSMHKVLYNTVSRLT